MSNDLVDAVKTDWNAKGIFKRIEKEEDKQIVVDSYCTRPYVQDVILRYLSIVIKLLQFSLNCLRVTCHIIISYQ